MPLDNAQYIKDLNPLNPVGTIDKVSLLDDVIREFKGTVKNTFPNLDGQVNYSTAELNLIRQTVNVTNGAINVNNATIRNVAAIDDITAVQPRSYNDARYLQVQNNLNDVPNKNQALNNLFAGGVTGPTAVLLQKIVAELMYPIGSLYFNSISGTNPATILGFGTWVPFGAGRALIGVGALNDGTTAKTWINGQAEGSYTHTLTQAEMPAHTHDYEQLQIASPSPDTKHGSPIAQYGMTNYTTKSTGGSQAHNNIQPSIAVYIWSRTE